MSGTAAGGDREIFLFAEGDREWAALLVAGRLEDCLAEDRSCLGGPRLGEVCVAEIRRLVAGGKAAFVDLGAAGQALLPRAAGLEPGDRVLVQVDRFAAETKSARVRQEVSLPGSWLVAVRGGEGVRVSRRLAGSAGIRQLEESLAPYGERQRLVLRTAAERAEPGLVLEEARWLADRLQEWEAAAGTGEARTLQAGPGPVARALSDWGADGEPLVAAGTGVAAALGEDADQERETLAGESELLEQHDLAGSLRRCLQPRVECAGGGWICIEPTAAVVAVDVNTGSRFLDRGAAEAVGRAAAGAIPRELRLRGLGGVIVIDFPPASDAGDEAVGGALEAALRADGPGARALGWTGAGLYELVRRRDRRPLVECFPDGV